jgi:hypothetical protein
VVALRRADPPSKEFYPTVYRIKKRKSGQGPKDCRTIEKKKKIENVACLGEIRNANQISIREPEEEKQLGMDGWMDGWTLMKEGWKV